VVVNVIVYTTTTVCAVVSAAATIGGATVAALTSAWWSGRPQGESPIEFVESVLCIVVRIRVAKRKENLPSKRAWGFVRKQGSDLLVSSM
jgi:hypothetical protein